MSALLPSEAAAGPHLPPPVVTPAFAPYSRRALGASALVLGAALPVMLVFAGIAPPALDTLFCALATAMALSGAVLGVRTWRRLSRLHPDERNPGRWLALVAVPVGVLGSLFGALLTLMSTVDFHRGRQIRRSGRVRLPRVGDGSGWLRRVQASPAGNGTVVPAEVAEMWRKNGQTEHASVAAFSHLSLQLLGLGAPARLLNAAHNDAADEVRHAELCFSLAASLDGRARGPLAFATRPPHQPFATRSIALAALAVESLVDGALNEGVSARVVAELVREVSDPRFKSVLLAIAGDEGRHAAHGWEVVRWCLSEGGAVVEAALRGAAAHLPVEMGTSLSGEAADGRCEAFGIPSRAREQRVYSAVRAEVCARLSTLLHTSAATRAAA